VADPNRCQKKYPVPWDVLHRDCKALSWRLMNLGPWEGILAITRSGLLPAAIIARELDIHLIDTIRVRSYDWKMQGDKVNVLKAVQTNGKGWLPVDDLVDTGKTARTVPEMVPEAHFASVYAKPEGRPRGYQYHRSQPGHLDPFSLGHGAAVRTAHIPGSSAQTRLTNAPGHGFGGVCALAP
jgi:xanthine phosphoribosyltransferase